MLRPGDLVRISGGGTRYAWVKLWSFPGELMNAGDSTGRLMERCLAVVVATVHQKPTDVVYPPPRKPRPEYYVLLLAGHQVGWAEEVLLERAL